MSRPRRIAGSSSPRRSTTTCPILRQVSTASSTICFSGTSLPLRKVRSAQNTALAPDTRPHPQPAQRRRRQAHPLLQLRVGQHHPSAPLVLADQRRNITPPPLHVAVHGVPRDVGQPPR